MSKVWMAIIALQAIAILVLGGGQLVQTLRGPAGADAAPAPLPGDVAPASTLEIPRSHLPAAVAGFFRPYLPLLAVVVGSWFVQRRSKSAGAKSAAELVLNNGAGLLLGQLLPLLSR
jgi:hypothetical protein